MRLTSNKANLWLCIIIFYIISTFILSSVTDPPLHFSRKIRLDWWLHGFEYGILAYLTMKYFSYRHFIGRKLNASITTLLLTGVVGGLNEALQAYVPHRTPSISDEIANLIGAAVFITVYLSLNTSKTLRDRVPNT